MRRYSNADDRYDAAPFPRLTRAVQRLILASVVGFAVQLVVDVPFGGRIYQPIQLTTPGSFLIDWLAFSPWRFLQGAVWTPLSYMFLHAGLLHLFLNMLWLFFFGPQVERVLGTRQFYRFYFFCGGVGVLASFVPALIPAIGAEAPIVGASGAVMGVVVAFAIVDPEQEFYLLPFPVPLNARALVIIVIVMNVISALVGTNMSVSTHFGGMLAGYAYMKLVPRLRRWYTYTYRGKREPKDGLDALGEAIDNIFRFEEEKRRRRR